MKKLTILFSMLMLLVSLVPSVYAADFILNPIADITVNEGAEAVIVLSYSGAEETNPVEFISATGGAPVTFAFELDTSNPRTTALLKTTPGASASGVYTVTVTLQDGSNSSRQSTQTFTFTINDVLTPGTQITINDVTIGGTSQERNNPRDDDQEDRIVRVSGELTVKNSGSNDVNGATITHTVLMLDAAEYNLSIDTNAFNIASGATKTVPFKVSIPKNLDAVDRTTLKALAWDVIKFNLNQGSNTLAESTMRMQARNHLEIKDVDVCRGDSCDRGLDNGDTYDDAKPGDQLTLIIELENDYKRDADLEIDTKVDVESDNNEVDVDDDSENVDVGEDEEIVEVILDVEDDADGTYTITIEAGGEDDNGAFHGQVFDIKIKVRRKSHEVLIDSATMIPSTLQCGQSSTQVKVDVKNIGKRRERNAEVIIEIDTLGIREVKRDLDIGKDDEESVSFLLRIPTTARPGAHGVEINSNYDRDRLSDQETLTLTIPDCDENKPAQDDKEDDSNTGVVVLPPQTDRDEPEVLEDVGTTTTGGSLTSSRNYIVGLGIAAGVLALVAIVLITLITRRKQ
jgi:hypothetical protein